MTTESEEVPSAGCGILGRHQILSVLFFASGGIALGVGLSLWEPDDDEVKKTVLQWIGLLGDLFIRCLKAIVLPLVFVNVLISVVDMMSLGRASSVGKFTVIFYTMTTFIAAVIGLLAILMFNSQFTQSSFEVSAEAFVKLGCTAEGSYLNEDMNGTVSCGIPAMEEDAHWQIDDVSGTFVRSQGGIASDISLSDTIYDGVFTKLITENIFYSFVDSNFAAVIVFAIFSGVALAKAIFLKGSTQEESALVQNLTEMSQMFIIMINWVISITPFAVFSLIANAIGKQDDLAGAFANVGWLIAASFVGFFLHFCITDIGLLYFFTRQNPFDYLRHIIPAQTTALACASSAATLPVTLRCVKATGMVPDDIRNFVCPLGATVNMDGSAIYFPCACVWLAYLNGITPNFGHYILLVILSTVGSVGTAPVPSSALVLIITAYNTVFGTSGVPEGFEFIVAIDWFMDRCITALNVTGDTVVSRIIAHRINLEGDMEREELEDMRGAKEIDATAQDETVPHKVDVSSEESSDEDKNIET